MTPYHKIQSLFKRDPATNHKTFLEGEYSIPEFEYLKDCQWSFTEKVDGTNIRIHYDPTSANGVNAGVVYGGRTDRAQIPVTLLAALDGLGFREKLPLKFDGPVTLYGEGYGPKIQKGGGNYREDQSFVLFDVKIGPWWLKRADVVQVAMDLGIDCVPWLEWGTLQDGIEMVRAGFPSTWGDFEAEGIVARPREELMTRSGQRIITKIKCRDYRHDA